MHVSVLRGTSSFSSLDFALALQIIIDVVNVDPCLSCKVVVQKVQIQCREVDAEFCLNFKTHF